MCPTNETEWPYLRVGHSVKQRQPPQVACAQTTTYPILSEVLLFLARS